MTRISVLLLVLLVCSATALQAQAQAPKPDPELKKLRVFVGHWTYEGESKSGPLGPGGKFTGDMTCQMILEGFFLQCQVSGREAGRESCLLEIDGYDPVNKDFSSQSYFDDGSRFLRVLTIAGNMWTYVGKLVAAGKEYRYKENLILAADLASGTEKAEISVDGKTWIPFTESKWTKVQPAPKK
jgi:hypothetical protein